MLSLVLESQSRSVLFARMATAPIPRTPPPSALPPHLPRVTFFLVLQLILQVAIQEVVLLVQVSALPRKVVAGRGCSCSQVDWWIWLNWEGKEPDWNTPETEAAPPEN